MEFPMAQYIGHASFCDVNKTELQSGQGPARQQLPVAAVQTTFRSKFGFVPLSIIQMTAGVIRAQADHSDIDTHTIYTSTHGASLHLSRHQRPFG